MEDAPRVASFAGGGRGVKSPPKKKGTVWDVPTRPGSDGSVNAVMRPRDVPVISARRILMQAGEHHGVTLLRMRTTITLADDVAAEVRRLRRERGMGPSAAVNELARRGMAARAEELAAYVPVTAPLGLRMDVSDIGAVLDILDDDVDDEAEEPPRRTPAQP